jgi:hypothetical protein
LAETLAVLLPAPVIVESAPESVAENENSAPEPSAIELDEVTFSAPEPSVPEHSEPTLLGLDPPSLKPVVQQPDAEVPPLDAVEAFEEEPTAEQSTAIAETQVEPQLSSGMAFAEASQTPADQAAPQKRTCIMVLGMHRSGTSAITGTLIKFGVAGPKTLVFGNSDNPKGHWESQPLIDFHDRLLASAGTNWHEAKLFNLTWLESDAALPFYDEAKSLFSDEYSNTELFVLKDPRICRFFPFWEKVLVDQNIDIKILIPFRNPLEVANSLLARNGFSLKHGLLLWLIHLVMAEKFSRPYPRCCVLMDDFLGNWRSVIQNIAAQLNAALPLSAASVESEIDAFLTPDLRHHTISEYEWRRHPAVHDWVKQAFDSFLQMSSGATSKSKDQQMDMMYRRLFFTLDLIN